MSSFSEVELGQQSVQPGLPDFRLAPQACRGAAFAGGARSPRSRWSRSAPLRRACRRVAPLCLCTNQTLTMSRSELLTYRVPGVLSWIARTGCHTATSFVFPVPRQHLAQDPAPSSRYLFISFHRTPACLTWIDLRGFCSFRTCQLTPFKEGEAGGLKVGHMVFFCPSCPTPSFVNSRASG